MACKREGCGAKLNCYVISLRISGKKGETKLCPDFFLQIDNVSIIKQHEERLTAERHVGQSVQQSDRLPVTLPA